MRCFSNTIILLIAGLLLVPAPQESQADVFGSVQSGSWNTNTTWEICQLPGDVCGGGTCTPSPIGEWPGQSDDVTICQNDVVYVTNSQAVDDLAIEAGAAGGNNPGVLELRSGGSLTTGVLTIGGGLTQATDPTYGDGKITFTGSSTYPGELVFDASTTAAGKVLVSGSTGGKITVNSSYTLTLTGDIEVNGGDCTVNGKLLNNGDIDIKGADTLEIQGGGIQAASSGNITIDNASAVFKLNQSASTHVTNGDGKVWLKAGTIDADAEFIFNGEFEMRSGALDAAGLTGEEELRFCDGDCPS